MAIDLRSSELEHQFIQDRINNVEKHISDICTHLTAYTRKIAHVRDSGDELAKTVMKFASKEMLNQSLRVALTRFSDIMAAIQDYREAEVQRLDAKVIFELSSYGAICKQAKEELKKAFSARAKEMNKKSYLEKVRGKHPTNWSQITQAEREVDRAQEVATYASCHLAQQIDAFERRKLDDLKKIFLEFISIEMLFHTKALELYTKAYNSVNEINKEDDLQEFRDRFRSPFMPASMNLFPSVSNQNPEVTPPPPPPKAAPQKSCLSSAKRKLHFTAQSNEKTILERQQSYDKNVAGSSTSIDVTDNSIAESKSDSKDSNIAQTLKTFKWSY